MTTPTQATPRAYLYEHEKHPEDYASFISPEQTAVSKGYVCRPLYLAAQRPDQPVAYMHRWPGCAWELDFADDDGKLRSPHSAAIPLLADEGRCAHTGGDSCHNSAAPAQADSAPIASEPVEQIIEDESDGAWAAFEKSPNAEMSNRDDLWQIWHEGWVAARSAAAPTPIAPTADAQPAAPAQSGEPDCHDTCDVCWGENGQKWPCAKRVRSSPAVPTAMSELREAARQFHNLTQGDPTVIIRPPSAEKRDAIIAAGERLRVALVASSTGRGQE